VAVPLFRRANRDEVAPDWKRLASHPDFQRLWESTAFTARIEALEAEREKTTDPARFQAIQEALSQLRWVSRLVYDRANIVARIEPADDEDETETTHPLYRRGGA
jgi:hypothetical protein